MQSHKSSGEYALEGKTAIKELTDDSYGIAMAYYVGCIRAISERFGHDNLYLYGVLTMMISTRALYYKSIGMFFNMEILPFATHAQLVHFVGILHTEYA